LFRETKRGWLTEASNGRASGTASWAGICKPVVSVRLLLASGTQWRAKGMTRDGDYFMVPGRIDWMLLARQKRWLLEHARASEETAGLVELQDTIQDPAVDQAGVPEATVFPERGDSR
jgi:hypothetical protein